jgi:iron complex outermembrane receptor protein
MIPTYRLRAALSLTSALLAANVAFGETDSASSDQATNLPGVNVTGQAAAPLVTPTYPSTTATINADKIDQTINAVDVEDAVKYLPSLFVRKRNYGDTQPVLATRTWGLGSSARTLVYVDDIPISALIANNNTIGSPRWGMVAPDEIASIAMLYGPFSAAFSGNALGGVLLMTTRTPDKPEASIEQTFASQHFDLYDTHNDYPTSQTALSTGGKAGAFHWFLSANVQNSFAQPLSIITSASVPVGTDGTIPATNKLGQPANVVGAGGLLHTLEQNVTANLGYDFSSTLHASYLVGYWNNDQRSRIQSYLEDTSGAPTFGKVAGFASNNYQLDEEHLMQALSLKSDGGGTWDGEAVATHYDYLRDRQLSPAGVGSGATFTPNGRLADFNGTGWSTLDLKGIWRPNAVNEVSFGGHADEYVLKNPTYNTTAWQDGGTRNGIFTDGEGKTRTDALWAQDAWRISADWLATLGVRYEQWKASDGVNVNGGVTVHQPTESASGFSPKAVLTWEASTEWRLTGSLARAIRFPTVSELYQLVSTGSTFTSPNPDLKPERAVSGELAAERIVQDGSLRVSLFQENTRNALIAQTSTLPNVAAPVSFVQNVGEVRNRGVEIAADRHNVLVPGLELSGSLTFVDSTILSDPTFVSTTGTTAVGKHAPNIPRWRATAVATYAPDAHWNFTLAGRYSGKQYSTLDNTDNTSEVFGAFDTFLVFDTRVRYRFDEHLSAAFGVDNLNDRKYFLYHPFPERTYVADVKYTF